MNHYILLKHLDLTLPGGLKYPPKIKPAVKVPADPISYLAVPISPPADHPEPLYSSVVAPLTGGGEPPAAKAAVWCSTTSTIS